MQKNMEVLSMNVCTVDTAAVGILRFVCMKWCWEGCGSGNTQKPMVFYCNIAL